MIEILIAIVVVAVCVCVWLGVVLFKKHTQLVSLGQKFSDLSTNLTLKEEELISIKDENKNLQEQNIQNIQQITQLTTKLDSANEINNELKKRQDELDNKTREYFELKTKQMSENLLNLNSKEMRENSAKILESLITPLKDEINKYQKSNLEINNTFKVNFENLIIADLPFFLFFGNFAKMVNNHVGAHLITGCLCAASKHISAIWRYEYVSFPPTL